MTDKQFELARRLSNLALELDYAKGGFAPDLEDAADDMVDTLHFIAERLAAERSAELYAPDDDAPLYQRGVEGDFHEVQP